MCNNCSLQDLVSVLEGDVWQTNDMITDIKTDSDLSKLMSIAETCDEIKAHGVTTSQIYNLDPDGKGRVD